MCKLGVRQRACQSLKDLFTLLHRREKRKTWLIINHEFTKEAKTTVARFGKPEVSSIVASWEQYNT